jgi:hypothetical protein
MWWSAWSLNQTLMPRRSVQPEVFPARHSAHGGRVLGVDLGAVEKATLVLPLQPEEAEGVADFGAVVLQ